MPIIVWPLTGVYAACLLLFCLHVADKLHLTLNFFRPRKRNSSLPPLAPSDVDAPYVTVQLPIFNEKYVVEGLIDAATRLSYPAGRLEIQVIDDSDDETIHLAEAKVQEYQATGVNICYLRRSNRLGYKAGGLRYGLEQAQGDLVVIFDADFRPASDFLLCTVPYFTDPGVAVVQTRWGYLNRYQTALTQAQALMLDAHFTIDQQGRNALGCFINFNGSAGVWRKAAILEVGNWNLDTLTEDVDLSYRAQLVGWKFVYLGEINVPAELPANIRSFRVQQKRWMKGVAQNARRFLPQVLLAFRRSDPPSLRRALHEVAHLLEPAVYIAIFLLLILTPLLALFLPPTLWRSWQYANNLLLALCVVLSVIYYLPQGHPARGGMSIVRFLRVWSVYFLVTIGLSLHNSLAVLSGLAGQPGEFVRTPKGAERENNSANIYSFAGMDRVTLLEAGVWIYLLACLLHGWQRGVLSSLWLPAFGLCGFTYVLAASFCYAVVDWWERYKPLGYRSADEIYEPPEVG